MSALGILLPLAGFVLVALATRALALELRRRGYSEMLDSLYLRAQAFQIRALRGKAIVLRSVRPPSRRRHRDLSDFD